MSRQNLHRAKVLAADDGMTLWVVLDTGAELAIQAGQFTEAAVGDRVVVAMDDPNTGVAVKMLPRRLPFSYSTKHIR
jgi:hypothetical protein